jgi:hypothetical protein
MDGRPDEPKIVQPTRAVRRYRKAGDTDDRDGNAGAPGGTTSWQTLVNRRTMTPPPAPPPTAPQ